MPLPKEVTFVTFDVYGTLIDWESGAYDAFAKEAEKDGYTLSREELIHLIGTNGVVDGLSLVPLLYILFGLTPRNG